MREGAMREGAMREGAMRDRSRRGRRRWAAFLTPALLALLFLARCQGGLRDDELYCEQAANELAGCCAGFDPTNLSCTYGSSGCQTSYPALTVAESDCILAESCASLVSTRVCARAMEALPIQTTGDGGLTNHPQVCP